ncbi:class I SAM-dependent methyltransferase [Acidipropionibacterium timonense]|uniref:class I SAM-dependent methyltransferase n=1 Tax=Acidipropionibacterium timonense TaxID=2161818 RepID=UPI0010309C1B|nr:class I SAM-dependent methyltransferase [Acidipropionibacterium timonense]
MPSPATPRFPAGSLEWLCGERLGPDARILTVAAPVSLCRTLAAHGARVMAVHPDLGVAAVSNRIPGVTGVCAMADSLPLDGARFDAALVHQHFHRLAPGLVLPELARILRPDGCLGISWLVRDDSIPWVRRLATLLRTVDPSAMTGDYGTEAITAVEESAYFPSLESRSHRLWVPVTKAALVEMAMSRPAVQALDEAARAGLQAQVERLHDDSCGPGGLRLPYELACWRAWVDHDELTQPIEVDRHGLVIRI